MPAVGDLLADRYRVDGVLGAGGMATVYLATDLRLERQVAIKVLLPNLARDPSLADRFDREARILASVAHPSVAEIFDVERGDPGSGREPFYVMELCDGGTLAERIEASGPLEPGELVPIIVVMAAAVGELHRRGLIHRDIKPANILFTGGRPKLADFGLAKSGGAGFETFTEPGTAIGTPAYMAPELVRGGVATVASDVYALGATTFHGLTGRAPRAAETLTGLAAVASDAIPTVSTASPRLGGAFDAVIAAALSAEPADRPSLVGFSAGLVAALGRSPAPADHSPPADPTPPANPTDDTTIIAPVSPRTRIGAPAPTRPSARLESRSAGRRLIPLGIIPAAFLFGVLLALVAAMTLWSGAGGPSPSPSATTAPTPSPFATSVPTPTPSPTPTVDPRIELLRRVDEVEAAINQAKGGHDGLGGTEAKELLGLADDIRAKLLAGDDKGARTAAERLLKEARKATEHVDEERAQILIASIEELIAAIPA